MLVSWTAPAVFLFSTFAQAEEPRKKGTAKVKEGAYYEFRGRVADRNTLDHTFTLGWSKGSQTIVVNRDTKIFRKGQAASLEEIKAGDAARGVGLAKNGRLLAFAVAFGDEGVELPPGLNLPETITLPRQQGD